MAHSVNKVYVGGVGVRVWRGGAGKPAVFLHGANGVAQWNPFFEALARRFDLLVPEHPGFGGSDDPKWIRNVPDLGMFYLDFLDALDLKGVHLIGTSLGGWVAAELAARNCTRLASLTLVAPAGVRVKGVPSGDMFMWGPEETARNLFHDPAFAEAMLAAPVSDEQADVMLKNRFAATKYGWQPRWFNPDLEKWLHRIKVPTHIVWGDDDKLMPPQYAEVWRARIPGAQLTRLAACGHLPHVEKTEALVERVNSFWNRIAA